MSDFEVAAGRYAAENEGETGDDPANGLSLMELGKGFGNRVYL